jgi:hypothetical protein
MANTQYTFDTQPNEYFRGTDLRVTDGTDHTIIVNVKGEGWAVNVKDDTIFSQYPQDVRDALDEMSSEQGEAVYQGVQAEFWRWADEAAKRYGFGGVSQEGHSGGWLSVDGSAQRFPEIIEPTSPEAIEARDAFLALAFEVERSIEDDWRPQFYAQVKAAAAEPEPTTEPLKVLALTFDGERTELYRNVPAVEHTFGITDDAAELVNACKEAVNGGGGETLRPTFDGDEARVEYLEVRDV